MSKKRIYICGAYSGPDVISILGNMRRGLQLSADAAKCGFAVYSPWCDHVLHFLEEFTLEQCYGCSMPWLEVSDAVLVVEQGAEQSKGTQAELVRARELGIPIFTSLRALCQWNRSNGGD